MPNVLLGLHGYKGCGKTTCKLAIARLIENSERTVAYDDRTLVHFLAFAEPLKRICKVMFGDFPNWDGTQAQKDEPIPDIGNLFPMIKTFRDAMQFIGTNVFREHVDKDVWVKLLQIKIAQLLEKHKLVRQVFIIDDVRFPNEAIYIHNHGGAVVRINKAGQVSSDTHASEKPLEEQYLKKNLTFVGPNDIELSAGYIYSLALGNAS